MVQQALQTKQFAKEPGITGECGDADGYEESKRWQEPST